jgi:RHS repeat-associated protein
MGAAAGATTAYQYNGIEHVDDFDLNVNMAMYRTLDPVIGRWWGVDPKAEATMGLTPYGSMNNSPMSFSDPDGDLAFIAAVGIGAALGVIGNGVSNTQNNQPFFQGAGRAAAFGAIGGAVSFGIGSAATSLAGAGASNLGVAGFQAGAHALTGGALSAAQGGNFWHGAAAGAFSSAVGSGIGALGLGDGWQILGGTLSGGFGSVIAGGNFLQGALQGAITSGLNHAAHNLFSGGPPYEYNGVEYNSKSELYTAILINTAADQFGITDILALTAAVSGAPILSTRGKRGGATPGTSPASKYLSKIPGKSPVRLPGVTGYPKALGGRGMRIAFTKSIGRFAGRAIPIVGWGTLAYDVGATFYRTQVTYNRIVN